MKNDPLLIQCLHGTLTERVPFWFMRQAGRYLPEYREVRKSYTNFLDFCYTPEAAVKVTLQPIERFDMDAAIMFSDILVLPHALGQKVWFEQGEGPRLEPVTTLDDLKKLSHENLLSHLAPVFEILRTLRKKLPPEKALIGFAGSPWTIACYMINGRGDKEFKSVLRAAQFDTVFLETLISLIVDATILYLKEQIKNGAQVIQLFDSWSGLLEGDVFTKWVIFPTQKICSELRKAYPDIPIIGFPRQSGKYILDYASKTGVNAVSVDESHPHLWVKSALQPQVVVQGALSNTVLAEDETQALEATETILREWSEHPFIFNLAHGILPHTPVEHVEKVSKHIHAFRRML